MERSTFRLPFSRNVQFLITSPTQASDKKNQKTLPAILALHGMGESAQSFQDKLLNIPEATQALWIFPDGPFPFERRSKPEICYSWYLFAQDQELLRKTMLEVASFLAEALKTLSLSLAINKKRLSVLGFSQGGYLAGVLAAEYQDLFLSACCIGGRFKHEFFQAPTENAPVFLQLHGAEDRSVSPELARKAVDQTKKRGYQANFQLFENHGHECSAEMVCAFLNWEKQLSALKLA